MNDGSVIYVALATLPVVPGALCQPARPTGSLLPGPGPS